MLTRSQLYRVLRSIVNGLLIMGWTETCCQRLLELLGLEPEMEMDNPMLHYSIVQRNKK